MSPSVNKWNPVSRGLHWLVALLILSAWGAVELHEFYEKGDPMREWWEALHFSIGLTILLLVVFRLYWRVTHPRPDLFGGRWQRKLSLAVEGLLYVAILALPLSGLAMRQLAGKETEFFGLFNLPRFLAENKEMAEKLAFGHQEVLWNGLLALLILHVTGALWHHFGKRDDTLKQMLPWGNTD